MLAKFKFNLSSNSIGELLDKINRAEQAVKKATKDGALETAKLVSEYIVKPATPVDTGESRDSTKVINKGTKITIQQSGTHVFENEFGTGPVGASSPHPNPPSDWKYVSNYWYFTPKNPKSKYYHLGANGKPKSWRTYGQVASAQMYKGAQSYKENVKDIIMIKIGDELSKI